MNVVSIMAHQDDEMRCLGTMLKCRARGDRLFFITLTDGSGGFVQQPDIPREEAAAIRHEEMSRLAQAAGADYINLRELDEFLYDTPDLRRRLIGAIRQTGANLIFTHHDHDYNLDHTTTHSLVRHCAMQSCLPMIRTDAPPLAEHPAIFCVQPHGPIPFHPTHFVDIADFEEQKIQLMKLHRSQDEATRAALRTGLEDYCRRPDAYGGDQVGCRYAEGFVPMAARGAIKPHPVLP